MAKTIEEFRDELKALREEMYQNSENADTKLIASWLDRLVISLEGLTENLAILDAEIDTACECCSGFEPAKQPVKAKKTRTKKAKATKKNTGR